MSTCDGCAYYTDDNGRARGPTRYCHYAATTGRVRLQDTASCTHYTKDAPAKPRVEPESVMTRKDRSTRGALSRLSRLHGRIPRQLLLGIKAQILRGEVLEASRGMDRIERRLEG